MNPTPSAHKKFNDKRPGALIGVMAQVLHEIEWLFADVRNMKDGHGSRLLPSHSENSPRTFCSVCSGKGTVLGEIDPGLMIAPELSLKHGAVLLWAGTVCKPASMIKALARTIGIDYERPLAGQDERYADILLYGYDREPISYVHKGVPYTGIYRGCVHDLRSMRDGGTTSMGNLRAIAWFSRKVECPECGDSGMNADNETTLLMGKSVKEVAALPLAELLSYFHLLPASLDEDGRNGIGERIAEIEPRLLYLHRIGLKALTCSLDGSSR